jgi:excisionase family DNA binding protein
MFSSMGNVLVMSAEEARELIRGVLREELGQNENSDREFLTAEGVAALLDVHPKTVAKLVTRENLPARRLGRSYRFHRSEVLQWLERRAVRPGARLARHAETLQLFRQEH